MLPGWEGPRVAVPVIRDGNMPSLSHAWPVEMSSLFWGERERVLAPRSFAKPVRAVHVLNGTETALGERDEVRVHSSSNHERCELR